jgi:hypothetical protein
LEIEYIKQGQKEHDAYSLYVYAIRTPITRDVYLRRLRIFFNHIHLLSINETMKARCELFAENSRANPKWAFNNIMEFLRFQKERVEKREISPATLRNFVKAIKLFQSKNF